jgi:4-diphosphocytidyl-2-C-methyl-D-erythritol kinase
MKQLNLKAYAKINLAIDVLRKLPTGFHEVSMVMQQIELHDKVSVKWIPGLELSEQELTENENSQDDNQIKIEVNSNKGYLPKDERNLAYKAAQLIIDRFDIYAKVGFGEVRIDIKKQIPVGAGLGGGSADCAAVLHALKKIWKLNIKLSELCDLGAELGSDVPFCIMGQAGKNAALAEGTGTKLTEVQGVDIWLVLSKPPISVSTADVYKGFSEIENKNFERPDIKQLIVGMSEKKIELISKNIVNVLENFTLKAYPSVMYTKNKMKNETNSLKVVMSGSGPTIVGFYTNKESAQIAFEKMLLTNKETFLTRTKR